MFSSGTLGMNCWLVKLLWMFLLSKVIAAEETPVGCSTSQFDCGNGFCIPKLWQCDGETDCNDSSDELNCTVDELKTCAPNEFRCSNSMCIPSVWQCDGENDCEDGLDEMPEQCGSPRCGSDQFRCLESGQCISADWVCDDKPDCSDGSDEVACLSCGAEEFKCRRRCIKMDWVCDGAKDCEDGEDERQCKKKECNLAEEMVCSDGSCVSKRWICDRQADCIDGEDEKDCVLNLNSTKNSTCPEDQFWCKFSRQCIQRKWVCDGGADCKDGSDESEEICGTQKVCRDDEMKCNNGDCIPIHLRCSGSPECLDGSDELNCPNSLLPAADFMLAACDPRKEFDCGNGKCVPQERVCDTIDDCGNGADEPRQLCGGKQCDKNNGGCEQRCVDSVQGPSCFCWEGYTMNSNYSCVDIDECSVAGACSQHCVNTAGSFRCHCETGYRPDPADPTRCKAERGRMALIFAQQKDILLSDIRHNNSLSVVKGASDVSDLDFHFEAGQVFWSDGEDRKIFRATIVEGNRHKRTVIHQDAGEGIAVDWIHDNLYWICTPERAASGPSIAVSDFDGSLTVHIITEKLDQPRSLALHPAKGWLFWSDWGEEAKIERAGTDGSLREVLVNKNIIWPNGITIDNVLERLYWVDAKLHTISSISIFGGKVDVILHSSIFLNHPFSVAVFEDWLYWTERGEDNSAIYRANKFNGSSVAQFHVDVKQTPRAVKIYHKYVQPAAENFCRRRLDKCSDICVPAPLLAESQDPRQPGRNYTDEPTAADENNERSNGTLLQDELFYDDTEEGDLFSLADLDRSRRAPEGDASLSRCLCTEGRHLAEDHATCVFSNERNSAELRIARKTSPTPSRKSDDDAVFDDPIIYGIIIGVSVSVILFSSVAVLICLRRMKRSGTPDGETANGVTKRTAYHIVKQSQTPAKRPTSLMGDGHATIIKDAQLVKSDARNGTIPESESTMPLNPASPDSTESYS